MAWYKDGFFYSRYNKPKEGDELKDKNEFHKVFYHNRNQTLAELIPILFRVFELIISRGRLK